MMKRTMLVLTLTAVAVGLSGADVSAISGSCKKRDSYDSPWRPVRLSFEQCKADNQKKDGDNIFDKRGLVWWDSRG